MDFRRRALFILIVVAIVSSAISPACAFISGKSDQWIEICSGSSTKTIPSNIPSDDMPDVTNSCAFCFQATHFVGVTATNELVLVDTPHQFFDDYINADVLIRHIKPTQARAPPLFLSL